MTLFLTLLHILVCFVLIVVILIQGGRGQGLTGPSFGSGNVQSLFGTRAADFITKATSVSAICFLFTCIGLNYIETQKSRSLLDIPRRTQSIDVDAVKKALEKIKAKDSAANVAETAKPAAPPLPSIPGKSDVKPAAAKSKSTA